MAELIAIVDDERDLLRLLKVRFERAGFEVELFPSAEGFFEFIKRRIPDLVVLDVLLGTTNGFEVCEKLKAQPAYSSIPIIMLTAKVEEEDKVLGLSLGADDYVTKPFSSKELLARVRAVLRRYKEHKPVRRITVDDALIIDLEKLVALLHGKRLELTPLEFKILKLLATYKNRAVSRESLTKSLWHEKALSSSRALDVHIRNLRKKLGSFASNIKSERGIGYKLIERQ